MKLKSKSWCVTSPGSAVWTPGWAVPSECGRSSEPAKIDFDSWNVKFWPRSMEQPILCSVCRQSQQHTGERAIWVAILKQSSWHGIRFCSSAVQPFKLSGLHFMRRRHSNCLVFNSCCAWSRGWAKTCYFTRILDSWCFMGISWMHSYSWNN